MKFRKTRRGIDATLDEAESGVLLQCASQLLELLGDSDEVPDDPIAAMVGLSSTNVDTPDDPALARLLPDAYGDDPAAAVEFRRYTEADLRATKRMHASTVLAALPSEGGTIRLDRDDADAWLGCLNDLRLVLGSRLEVTEDLDFGALDPEDPRTYSLVVYDWLGGMQESLLRCLTPRQ